MAERARALGALALALVLSTVLTGCGMFGDKDGEGTSVFDIKPGMCFEAQDQVKAQIGDLTKVSCATGHGLEAYALVAYDREGDAFPGDAELGAFADGHCAQEFRDYVGIDYLDSDLFFTYLLPSPRSWEQDDRDVLCLVTSAGEPLRGSVKGSKR